MGFSLHISKYTKETTRSSYLSTFSPDEKWNMVDSVIWYVTTENIIKLRLEKEFQRRLGDLYKNCVPSKIKYRKNADKLIQPYALCMYFMRIHA